MKKLVSRLREALAAKADPAKAGPMQAYMKSAMPYHGVPSPVAKKVFREVFSSAEFAGFEEWREAVLELWRQAKFREERYGAIALSGVKAARPFQTVEALPIYEEMIVSGAWWDYVDDVAIHRVGPLVGAYPREMKAAMRRWSRCGDTWKQRTSIICQNGLGEKRDVGMLFECIEPSLDSKEFFLRKAIGWALRELAWKDPGTVVRYVEEHRDRLSGLSVREALKNVRS